MHRRQDSWMGLLWVCGLLAPFGCAVTVAGQVADAGTPSADVPGVDVPGVDVPEVDVPGVDVPGVDIPRAPDAAPSRFVTQVAPGTCTRMSDGSMWCWGINFAGQVGDGTNTTSLDPALNPFLTNVTYVARSTGHACAIVASGAVWCWGGDEYAEAAGTTRGARRYVPRPVAGVSNAVQLALGRSFSCALVQDGSVWCWGSNNSGELGRPGMIGATITPEQIRGVAGAVQIAAGLFTACARIRDGSLMCWGSNQQGSVGDGSISYSAAPTRAALIDDAIDVGTGEAHTCALRRDRTVWCWGTNRFNALGTGSSRTTPQAVPGVTGVQQIAVGQTHTCVRLSDGTVQCWGTNNGVEASPAWSGVYGPTPVTIAGTRGSIDVQSGAGTLCVRFADGHIACWGANYGALGNGGTGPSMAAVPVVLQ